MINIPKVSRRAWIETDKYKQIGDVEIEFFVSRDEYNLPLKMAVEARLRERLRITIEVYLEEYSSGHKGSERVTLKKILL